MAYPPFQSTEEVPLDTGILNQNSSPQVQQKLPLPPGSGEYSLKMSTLGEPTPTQSNAYPREYINFKSSVFVIGQDE